MTHLPDEEEAMPGDVPGGGMAMVIDPSEQDKGTRAADVVKPLAALGGERPPRPRWFARALEQRAERLSASDAGATVEILGWGEVGRPGLLFLPGMGAGASWWEPIAPFFADDYRCATLSWSGMGRSDWRAEYSMDLFVREIDAAIETARLSHDDRPPIIIAHSFSTMAAALWAERNPSGGMVLVDRIAFDPVIVLQPMLRERPARRYASPAEALINFRLSPPEPCENLFFVDHVAREGMMACEEQGQQSWTWCYDVTMRGRLTGEDQSVYGRLKGPLAFLWGGRSRSIANGGPDYVRDRYPRAPSIVIPDSGHHVMLDQPIATIAVLRALLQCWSADGGARAEPAGRRRTP